MRLAKLHTWPLERWAVRHDMLRDVTIFCATSQSGRSMEEAAIAAGEAAAALPSSTIETAGASADIAVDAREGIYAVQLEEAD